ncbi:unnamed protein product [Anisakis simplex]|uniref:BPTI/Kunitz inhibitor domain-containing protein n=1 Tax=Anisakis simplex TaxID=6269 RepID=A0A3P6RK30_ANISI|nr:unnamed protein product [Anisakis simplex]
MLAANNRPRPCKFGPGACGAGYWCHLGLVPAEYQCCPGEPTNPAACQGLPYAVGISDSLAPPATRWYYNQQTRTCGTFQYNGLKGNQNNFLTKSDCEQTCHTYVNACPSGTPLLAANNRPRPCQFGADACGDGYWCHLGLVPAEYQCCPGEPTNPAACQGMPYAVGVSDSLAPPATRWYYNQQSKTCETFQYNGLKGNQNNFLTKTDCEQTCHVFLNPCIRPISLPIKTCSAVDNTCTPGTFCLIGSNAATSVCCPSEGNPCLLPQTPGTGSFSLQRWYFNSQSGSCQQFIYTGLKGNENNFLTREKCEETCGPNPCPQGRPFLAPDGRPQSCNAAAQSSTCPNSYWCHTGANALNTVCCPNAVSNPCSLPLSTGQGSANLERFYFDPSVRACRPFIYKGSRGNQNNFLTLRACQMVCQPLQNPCIGQPATTAAGQVLFCSATNKDTCPVNFWCHVGANPETTVCCPGATNPCSVPLSPGTGNAGLQRWYYNPDDRECQPFQYNGLRGNQNNFETQAECTRTCPVLVSPCIDGKATRKDGSKLKRCNPLIANSCGKGYFCLAGNKPFKRSSFCCPKRTGDPCKALKTEGEGEKFLPRWYYSSTEQKCLPFNYRGRKGNENNFLSKRQCEKTCLAERLFLICGIQVFYDLPKSWDQSTRFIHLPELAVSKACFRSSEPLRVGGRIVRCANSQSCPSTHYCHIGADSRSSVCCKRIGNVCEQELVVGVGSAQLSRWYYNNVQGECLEFMYSGLGGNENNFITKNDCEVSCPGSSEKCRHGKPLPMNRLLTKFSNDTHNLNTFCPKGYISQTTNSGPQFACCPDPANYCLLRPGVGPCSSTIPRYSFNRFTGTCQQFKLSSDEATNQGDSRLLQMRQLNQCIAFDYTGCGGNLNNFQTMTDCMATCGSIGF